MVIATFVRSHLRASDHIVPFKNIGREGLGTDVRHWVFLDPKVVLFQSLGGCGWSSLIAVAAHLSPPPRVGRRRAQARRGRGRSRSGEGARARRRGEVSAPGRRRGLGRASIRGSRGAGPLGAHPRPTRRSRGSARGFRARNPRSVTAGARGCRPGWSCGKLGIGLAGLTVGPFRKVTRSGRAGGPRRARRRSAWGRCVRDPLGRPRGAVQPPPP